MSGTSISQKLKIVQHLDDFSSMPNNAHSDLWFLHTVFVKQVLYDMHRVSEKNGPIVISSYVCFDSYELHDNFQKYTGVACCEYGINVCESLAIVC